MSHDETASALVAILSNLAKQHDPQVDRSFPGQVAANGGKAASLTLPGPDSETKRALERELAALSSRVQYLEAKARTVDNNTFPITPGEPNLHSPFPGENHQLQTPQNRAIAGRDRQASWVTNWLKEKETPGERAVPAAQLTEDQLAYLRDHLNKQAEQIQSQREHIDSLSAEVTRQLRDQDKAFGHGIEDIGALKRELQKHQQANLAFQKALREIGSIVTAVAHGDLSKKVLIHAKEMDPEITTFKRTINTMVDQLQDFASQVTNLAKEVGTEGRLGGQAVLTGVDGIWAELTNSGRHQSSRTNGIAANPSQSTTWHGISRNRCEKSRSLQQLSPTVISVARSNVLREERSYNSRKRSIPWWTNSVLSHQKSQESLAMSV